LIPWHFAFSAPDYLFALLIVPLLFAFFSLVRRRRARFTTAYTNLDVLAAVVARRGRRWQRQLSAVLLSLALAAGALALARPRVQLLSANRTATIIMLVDISDSMRATDIVPSRLDAAVVSMRTFLGELPAQDKVALVTFSDNVQVLDPPTTNRTAINSSLDVLSPQGGTALGDAVEAAVKLAVATLSAEGVHRQPGKFLPAAIVLESDGAQNRGKVSPFQAGNLAHAAGVRVYGIALGRNDAEITIGSGYYMLHIPVPPDPGAVGVLARDSGGQAYDAADSGTLDQIYRHLGKTIGTTPVLSEVTSWFELGAAILLVAGVAAARLRGAPLP
jgi:Ca-activated chloride channel family protein